MKMFLHLGDWSKDGHNQSTKFLVDVNVTPEEIRSAYLAAVERTGITFDHHHKGFQVCTGYEESTIPNHILEKFKDLGMPVDDLMGEIDEFEDSFSEGRFAELWFQFVKTEIPSLTWSFVENQTIPNINGPGSGSLRVQFGYGLYR